jgi:hypothetical protein
LPPSLADVAANLMPASGHQDHATSPSASSALVSSTLRVHRIPPLVDDVGQRPSLGKDTQTSAPDLPDGASAMFLRRGLDRANRVDPPQEFSTCAQRPSACPEGSRLPMRDESRRCAGEPARRSPMSARPRSSTTPKPLSCSSSDNSTGSKGMNQGSPRAAALAAMAIARRAAGVLATPRSSAAPAHRGSLSCAPWRRRAFPFPLRRYLPARWR